ncbi:uncharacterized protein LOC143028580 isoform X1 [Oratosquilla oratoria]|uniref:uncharacterized protein LOC143028580 isoform X1 n=2 Tax=Oratosquilla oratoria TaxID=337810 RepID=UPI003F7676EF
MATKMATCTKLMLLVVVGVLTTLVSHADSRSPIPPPFHCKYYCKIRDGSYECCDDGYPIDERCYNSDIVYVDTNYCPPWRICAGLLEHKKCGTIRERCSGNEFCCPLSRDKGDPNFVCAYEINQVPYSSSQ